MSENIDQNIGQLFNNNLNNNSNTNTNADTNNNQIIRDTNVGLIGVDYTKPVLSNSCIRIQIPKYEEIFKPSDYTHPFFTYHDKDFSKSRYKYGGLLPLHIGSFDIDQTKHKLNVLRCSVKDAGSNEIILPSELDFLTDFVKFCCLYESSFNTQFTKLFMHITVDKKTVEPNTTQRVSGFHVDGYQGHKFPIKHEIEHSYLWCSDYGTEFCPQPFFIEHIDDSKYMLFDEFNKQANELNVYKCLPSNVYIFDPYMVHRSPVVTKRTERLIIRLTCEYQKLLDPNDTINPNLQYDVPYKYDVRNRLGTFKWPLTIEHYGFNK